VTTAGLVLAMSGTSSAADPHQHCLLTPEGYVPIATGVSEQAAHDHTLETFHSYAHRGEPGQQLTISHRSGWNLPGDAVTPGQAEPVVPRLAYRSARD
jgi:hypothetical protein